MLAIFIKTLPFFAVIGIGYWAGRSRFFSAEATAYLTKFVFYFALSAMLFRFSANLSLAEVWDTRLVAAYLWGTAFVYGVATAVAFLRQLDVSTTAIEAQCAVIGNTGFLGVPMLTLILGEEAIGPILLALAIDLIVFSSLIVILITGARRGQAGLKLIRQISVGLIKNPMIVAICLGFLWSGLNVPIPAPINDFLSILGGAATPGALFAIGASLALTSPDRLEIAGWLSFCKLVLHPLFVGFAAVFLFHVDPFKAGVIIAVSALPVAGNVFILAQHYNVAPTRVSTAILVSTALSIITVSLIIGWSAQV
ncbi:MAG: AEC family transporter [Pseudomonadota bacterium]